MANKTEVRVTLTETQDAFVSGYALTHNISKNKACSALIQEGIVRLNADLFEDNINSSVRKTMEAISLVEQRMREDMMHDLTDEILDTLDATRISTTALMLFLGGDKDPEQMKSCYEKALKIVYNIED